MIEHFSDVFGRLLNNLPLPRLAQQATIPKQTLASWKEGRVKQPRNLLDVLLVVAALRCDPEDVDTLLVSAGYEILTETTLQSYIEQLSHALSVAHSAEAKTLCHKKLDLLTTLKRRLFNARAMAEPRIPTSSASLPASILSEKFPHLPAQPYNVLVGREEIVRSILSSFQDVQGPRMIGIDGLGGIGKTSIAYEVANQVHQAKVLDHVVWVRLGWRTTTVDVHPESTLLTFEGVLDAIALQLGQAALSRLPIDEKTAQVSALLQQQKMLVVLDNLESVGVEQDLIIEQLQPLLKTSRALLTSRHRFQADVYSIHLEGLQEQMGLRLLYQEAGEKGIERVCSAMQAELQPVVTTTGGSPLAMKLVVGQLAYLPLPVVLERLRNIQRPTNPNIRDEYNRLYRFIFFPSWQLLSDQGKQLLLALAHFAPGTGGTFDALQSVSQLPSTHFSPTIDELWQLSLIEVGRSSRLNTMRYYLHALTHHFVLSDIVQDKSLTEAASHESINRDC